MNSTLMEKQSNLEIEIMSLQERIKIHLLKNSKEFSAINVKSKVKKVRKLLLKI